MTPISFGYLDAAVSAVLNVAGALNNQKKRLDALDPAIDKELRYVSPDTLESRRERVRAEISEYIEKYKARFSEKLAEFRRYVLQCAYPAGENLISDVVRYDLYLLDHALINTPAELEHMRSKYVSASRFNPSVLRSIDHYAATMAWPGFNFDVDVAGLNAACDALEELAREYFDDPESTGIEILRKHSTGAAFYEFTKGAD